jgi:hypothetical protein
MEYDIVKDHEDIKEQIKDWEKRVDSLIIMLLGSDDVSKEDLINELENLSQEMCAINI